MRAMSPVLYFFLDWEHTTVRPFFLLKLSLSEWNLWVNAERNDLY